LYFKRGTTECRYLIFLHRDMLYSSLTDGLPLAWLCIRHSVTGFRRTVGAPVLATANTAVAAIDRVKERGATEVLEFHVDVRQATPADP
jgi:hypothetical protein